MEDSLYRFNEEGYLTTSRWVPNALILVKKNGVWTICAHHYEHPAQVVMGENGKPCLALHAYDNQEVTGVTICDSYTGYRFAGHPVQYLDAKRRQYDSEKSVFRFVGDCVGYPDHDARFIEYDEKGRYITDDGIALILKLLEQPEIQEAIDRRMTPATAKEIRNQKRVVLEAVKSSDESTVFDAIKETQYLAYIMNGGLKRENPAIEIDLTKYAHLLYGESESATE